MLDFTPGPTHRRGFLARLAAGLGIAAVAPGRLAAESFEQGMDRELEAWFNKMNGKHRIVFDAPTNNNGFIGVWPRVYLNTMNGTYGTMDADNTAVVIVRHQAAPLALNDAMWAKYGFAKQLKIDDNDAAMHNPYTNITDIPMPGLGIEPLLKAGVLFGVCNVALTVMSGSLAKATGGNADDIKKELVANRIPGVQVVPSGVMAVGRCQEKGCGYCFAG